MNSQFNVNQGSDKVMVELTVNEAMALTGVRFNQNPQVKAEARRKLHQALDNQLNLNKKDAIDYRLLV